MSSMHIPRAWALQERLATPEALYWSRRSFLQTMGIAGGALLGGCAIPPESHAKDSGPFEPADFPGAPGLDLYPAGPSSIVEINRPITNERTASMFNNFYEFSLDKDVYRYVKDFKPYPWTVEVAGLCNNPKRWDLDELVRKFALEERVYRFRCVEAWSMVVPWTGFALRQLLQAAEPTAVAKFVSFQSFLRPEEAPGQERFTQYKWPYYEALRLDEAMNELAFFTVGVYGHPLPRQHGAPWRLVLPWKYGYKGAKSIVRIEFSREQPPTFWNDQEPNEYGFYSNVNPKRPHPRWSQATERVLDTSERIPTRMYNGYEEQVAGLYPSQDPF